MGESKESKKGTTQGERDTATQIKPKRVRATLEGAPEREKEKKERRKGKRGEKKEGRGDCENLKRGGQLYKKKEKNSQREEDWGGGNSFGDSWE